MIDLFGVQITQERICQLPTLVAYQEPANSGWWLVDEGVVAYWNAHVAETARFWSHHGPKMEWPGPYKTKEQATLVLVAMRLRR